MSSQDHPTHNQLERLYCDEFRDNVGLAARASIERHLISCRLCRLRLGAIGRFVEQLSTGRIRAFDKANPTKADHISTDELKCYHLGQVHGYELARVEEHLLRCPHCLERMELTEQFVEVASRGIVAGDSEPELKVRFPH